MLLSDVYAYAMAMMWVLLLLVVCFMPNVRMDEAALQGC